MITVLAVAGCTTQNSTLSGSWNTASGTIISWETLMTWSLSDKLETITRKELIGPQTGTLYYIKLNDNWIAWEKIWCNDSIVWIKVKNQWWNLSQNIENLYKQTFKWSFVWSLENSLWTSNLQIISIKTSAKLIQVNLSWTIWVNGACEVPRIKAQLEKTYQQFWISWEIYINNKKLEDVLSLY